MARRPARAAAPPNTVPLAVKLQDKGHAALIFAIIQEAKAKIAAACSIDPSKVSVALFIADEPGDSARRRRRQEEPLSFGDQAALPDVPERDERYDGAPI